MKRKITLALATLVLAISQMFAGYTTPEVGKVYRIHNVKYEKVIGEDGIARQVTSVDAADDTDFSQLWVLKTKSSGYLLQNAYSGQYLSHCAQQSTQVYPTSDQEAVMYLTALSDTKYAIGQGMGQYLHLDGSNNIVRWWDKDTEPSQWQFEEVKVSNDEISLQQAAFQQLYTEYMDKLALMENVEEYNAQLATYFADAACTELLPAYQQMSDEALRTAMSALPTPLQDMAVKIKNQAWGHREQEFRIRNYKAYSDADYWAEKLYTKKYSRINNPTGIYGQAGDMLYIFVGNDIPEGTTLQAEVIYGSAIQGTAYDLRAGLNMIPTPKDYASIFIQYVGETSLESETLITDYPELKIHIEEGVVNGFWDIEEHDDEDWVDMMTNLATADMFQVKGERIMFHMSKHYMKLYCPNTISDAIGWWDDMTRWQQDLLGIEDVRLKKFNNLGCAISLTTGYQSATHYRTQYLDSYIGNLLPYENMMSNADNCWGPAHENGHVHQAAIQSVGTSEVTNNLFSNLTLFKLGRYTSRGNSNDDIFSGYTKHIPFILRDGATTLRLYWQLYLYFHEVKGDTTFYPRVFQAMRATPMKARDPEYYYNYVYGNEDLLIFAKACCDAAQMDLSEFFRLWGFLELTDKQHIGDYGNFYLTTRESDVEEFLAYASQYPKAPSIVFIEDRVKAEPRTDGIGGNKVHHGNAIRVGEAGDVGHYTDFKDTSVKAEGYIYEKNGTSISISGGTGAVGFKVYNKADNALLCASNRLTFNIPREHNMSDILIVAAQADGTDAPVKSIAEGGTEEQQLELLNKILSQANNYAKKSDDTGTKIGYFKPEAVIELNQLISKIEAVIQHSDQSEHTYGEWAMQLNAIVTSLHANLEARISMTPNSFYTLSVSNKSNQYLINANAGLRTMEDTSDDTPENMQWKIVAGHDEGIYYLQNRTSRNYITLVANGKRVMAESSDIKDAVAFTLVPDGPGDYFIQRADDNNIRLYNYGQNNQVFAGNQTGANAKWSITLKDDMLSLPELSTNEQLTIYYMMREDNGEYAYSNISKSSDRGRISTSLYSDAEDFNFWFYFKQGSQEGKYLIYNYATGKSVTEQEGKLFIDRDAETIPEYAIALNEQGTGFIISSDEGYWHMTLDDVPPLAEMSDTESTIWRLQRTRTISLIDEPITSLTINETKATLLEGDSIQLIVETAPIYATDHSVTWSSSDESVATVDSTGKVTAVAVGKAIITATANDSSGLTVTCEITVEKDQLTSITISQSEATLLEGKTITLTVTTAPEIATDHSVTWSSSDESVATVSSRGRVKAIAAGKATITVTANDGSGLTATCEVTVEKDQLTSITISQSEVTLLEGKTITLSVTTAPEIATDHSVTWSSSDESVATVNSRGEVRAIAAGKTIITATANDGSGVTAACEVTVEKEDTGISNTTTSALSVQSSDGAIIINGLAHGDIVRLYSIVGKLIATTTATDNTMTIDTEVTEGDIVIVVVGTYCVKIQIK